MKIVPAPPKVSLIMFQLDSEATSWSQWTRPTVEPWPPLPISQSGTYKRNTRGQKALMPEERHLETSQEQRQRQAKVSPCPRKGDDQDPRLGSWEVFSPSSRKRGCTRCSTDTTCSGGRHTAPRRLHLPRRGSEQTSRQYMLSSWQTTLNASCTTRASRAWADNSWEDGVGMEVHLDLRKSQPIRSDLGIPT